MSEAVVINLNTQLSSFNLSVNLRLPNKGVTVLFGPSGCGKTTLLRCVAGLHRAEGLLQVNEVVWQQDNQFVPVYQRNLGYVFQESQLFPHLNVRRNLQFGRDRIKRQQGTLEQNPILQLLDILGLLDRYPSQLSGGERQRVAIAQALLMNPQLLLMDEPLSALDDARKKDILPYLERLRDELNIPLIYVTHSVDEMMRLADHVVVLDQGKVVVDGPLNDIQSRLDLPTRLGEEAGVVIQGRIMQRDQHYHLARIQFEGGSIWVRDLELPLNHELRLRILARDISLALKQDSDTSILNIFKVVVDEVVDTEHQGIQIARVLLNNTPLLVRVTKRSVEQLGISKGKKLFAQIKTAAMID